MTPGGLFRKQRVLVAGWPVLCATQLLWAQDGAGWDPPQQAPFPLGPSKREPRVWLLYFFLQPVAGAATGGKRPSDGEA